MKVFKLPWSFDLIFEQWWCSLLICIWQYLIFSMSKLMACLKTFTYMCTPRYKKLFLIISARLKSSEMNSLKPKKKLVKNHDSMDNFMSIVWTLWALNFTTKIPFKLQIQPWSPSIHFISWRWIHFAKWESKKLLKTFVEKVLLVLHLKLANASD